MVKFFVYIKADFTNSQFDMQTVINDKTYLLDYSRNELEQYFTEQGLEKYRADQLFTGIYAQQITAFNQLTTFSKSLRDQLAMTADISRMQIVTKTISPHDDTTKFLWELPDGKKIESVIIYEGKRVTFCISSQVGCALDCKFCATGKMGFIRNLSSGEIIEQVLQMKRITKFPPTNIVYMGMGEPMLNLKSVLKAADVLSDFSGLSFSQKKITISTSGVIPGINKLAELDSPYSLAVSLNAVFEDKREKIMPVSGQYPLTELFDSIKKYTEKTGKRVTFEYVLINEINDSQQDADQLIRLTHGIPCKINLIPCNSDDPAYLPPSNNRIRWFSDYVHSKNRTVTVRLRKGWEIQAACGQLYFQHKNITGAKISPAKLEMK